MGRVVSVAASGAIILALQLPAGGEANSRSQPGRSATPELLLLDREYLETVRARLREGDATLTRALAVLEQDARKALSMAPVSVTDKTVTPPSGDKHDYMSQGPYWWPDPSKPDGLPYVRRDGVRNPEINRISDHANFDRVIGAVSTLGLAFYVTRTEAYAVHAARLARVWFLDPATRMNPHLRFGQGIPGITDGRGIGIIETRRLPELLDGILLISGSRAWSPADDAGLQAWMRAYLTWLLDSTHGGEESRNGNNHETWYDVQVAALALYTGQVDRARRTIEGSRERIARQIEPDGRQPRELERTRSWDYSVFNLRAFFELAALGARVGIPVSAYATADGRSLRRALDFLVPYATRTQTWTHPQITAFRPNELHWLLRRAAWLWREPGYRRIAIEIGGGSARLDLTTP